ncbi:Oidioi.mRNA.OKI2018_I69.XSR.g15667.t2.cds [Oikopleura dioica]|uniref:Oidioi.mRNA.OKI2018_I69.XSR.g15667.t2.cds n=1 Tax=Oikopleura dioica TaxID=34765 RepID=A0ABN7SHK3_OIKDI|nr:Oidioi.mRNA.OKI2018_I69.XSR.g15667.t2.cds [Oikopleura dioica]
MFLAEVLEDSYKCDGHDNLPFTVTRNGGQLFQCQNAAHFLEDEGLEAYLQNYGEECRLQRHYQKVARPILSGMGRRNTRSIKFSIPVLDGSLGNAIQLIVRHSESSEYQCSKKWNVREVLFCNLKTGDSRKRHWAINATVFGESSFATIFELAADKENTPLEYTVDSFLVNWMKHMVITFVEADRNNACPTVKSRDEPTPLFLAGKGGRYFMPSDSTKVIKSKFAKSEMDPSSPEIHASFTKGKETLNFKDVFNCSSLCLTIHVGNTFRQLGNLGRSSSCEIGQIIPPETPIKDSAEASTWSTVLTFTFLAILSFILGLLVVRLRKKLRRERTTVTDKIAKLVERDKKSFEKRFEEIGLLEDSQKMWGMLIPIKLIKMSDKKLGDGFFGSVHLAELVHNQKTVCVKQLRLQDSMSDDVVAQLSNSIIEEILRMKNLEHENVIRLEGFTLKDEGKLKIPMMILPFMESGDLQKYLANENNTINFELVIRDLAARNCLLDNCLKLKIADFGLSKHIDNAYENSESYVVTTQHHLPFRWMAPESLKTRTFNIKSDIWSYGILLWEITTRGRHPYGTIESSERLISYLENGNRLPKPVNCSPDLYVKVMECWDELPNDRPTFFSLSVYMRNYLTKIQQDSTMRELQLLLDDGFDENWLHCYAHLNTPQRDSPELNPKMTHNLNYDIDPGLTAMDLAKASQLDRSDEFLNESCGEVISTSAYINFEE